MTDDVLLDCPVLAWSVAALFERDMGREVLRGGTAPRSGGAIVCVWLRRSAATDVVFSGQDGAEGRNYQTQLWTTVLGGIIRPHSWSSYCWLVL